MFSFSTDEKKFKGPSWNSYWKKKTGMGHSETSQPGRAEYEAQIKKQYETKMNWGIKDRWEQRELDAVIKNRDVRAAQFRDLDKIKAVSYGSSIADFNSVDEIYYFMEELFTEGFDEKHISIALDVFLRDYGQFEETDLEKQTFKDFVRQLGINLITFTNEKNFVKAARFMDYYCVQDTNLWVNLEMYTMRKDNMFSPSSFIAIVGHFSAQQEGSRDLYDFYEFLYSSDKFKNITTHEMISLLYSFYSVHAGSVHFMSKLHEDLLLKMDQKTTTYDLLRVLQSYSEISKNYPKLFLLLENLFMQRFDQMTVDEMTTCASGFSISGFGTPYFSNVLEQGILTNVGHLEG